MSLSFEDHALIQTEIERILKKNIKFGPLHQLETSADGSLRLTWDNAALRPKAKAQPTAYMTFMEEISDFLSEHGYCLSADVDADEHTHNNYLLIEPEDDFLDED